MTDCKAKDIHSLRVKDRNVFHPRYICTTCSMKLSLLWQRHHSGNAAIGDVLSKSLPPPPPFQVAISDECLSEGEQPDTSSIVHHKGRRNLQESERVLPSYLPSFFLCGRRLISNAPLHQPNWVEWVGVGWGGRGRVAFLSLGNSDRSLFIR